MAAPPGCRLSSAKSLANGTIVVCQARANYLRTSEIPQSSWRVGFPWEFRRGFLIGLRNDPEIQANPGRWILVCYWLRGLRVLTPCSRDHREVVGEYELKPRMCGFSLNGGAR